MKIDKINKAANILYNSRINLKKIKELPEDCNPKNQNDAYAIQNALTKKYLFANDKTKVIGKKIGCTNKAAQNQLNVNESFFGNIFSNNISKSNCKISPKKYFSPFIEPEFSFLMKEELGREWLEPELFRFGASGLLTDIERQLEHFVTGRYSAAYRQPMG